MAIPDVTTVGRGLVAVLEDVADAVASALATVRDRRRPGGRPGQYHLDLVADAAALEVLHGKNLAVLSEESGRTGLSDAKLLAVVDPVDGSTNASLGLPWYATSACVLDDEGPLASVVVNQATGSRYVAVRGGGATRDGRPLAPSPCTDLSCAVVGISGFPSARPGWGQFRALGASALELCAVADGSLDAFTTAGRSALNGWDYLGALLVCTEAGAVVGEREDRGLVVRDEETRRPVAASSRSLYEALRATEV